MLILVVTLQAGLKIIQSYMEGYRQDWKLSSEKDTIARGGWYVNYLTTSLTLFGYANFFRVHLALMALAHLLYLTPLDQVLPLVLG